MELTILTPTYNRGNCLRTLFESLQVQKNKAFEWLIVDDGSSDDTENIVQKMITNAQFPIRYVKRKTEENIQL